MRRSRTGLIASATVAALGLVGCASSHGASAAAGAASGSGIMLTAYTHTVGQKTAKMSLTETVATSGGSAASPSSAAFATAAASGAANLSATITANGTVDFTGQAADLTMQIEGQSLEIREIGSTMYMHLGGSLAQGLPAGKSWISVDLNAVSQAKLGASLSSLTQTSQANPAQMLSYLQAVSQSGVHKAGTATLRGVSTTEYDATVDLTKLAAMQKTPAARQAISFYKTNLRPLIRQAQLFHISARPDGVHWDGMEYWDPAQHRGIVFAFRGSSKDESEHHFVLAGLDPQQHYHLHFEDGSSPDTELTGRSLMSTGLTVILKLPLSSELISVTGALP